MALLYVEKYFLNHSSLNFLFGNFNSVVVEVNSVVVKANSVVVKANFVVVSVHSDRFIKYSGSNTFNFVRSIIYFDGNETIFTLII